MLLEVMANEHWFWSNNDFLHSLHHFQSFSKLAGEKHEMVWPRRGYKEASFYAVTSTMKPRDYSLSCSRMLWPICASTSFPDRKNPAAVAANWSKWNLSSCKSQKASNHLIHMCTFARWMQYISLPASFTRWCMSSRLVKEYCTALDCHVRQSSISASLLMIGFQKRRSSSPCSVSSQSNVFRTNLNRSPRDLCVTMSLWPGPVKLEGGSNDSEWLANDSIAVYVLHNMWCLADVLAVPIWEKTFQHCAFLTLEPAATSLPSSFHAEHQAPEVSPKSPSTKIPCE